MTTLTIKYYRDSFNSDRVYAIKKSKHGHYFINQYNKATKLYSAFKRVSVKVVKEMLGISTPCNKPATGYLLPEIASVLSNLNMEANINVCKLYRSAVTEAVHRSRTIGHLAATHYLHNLVDQGYDREALQDCLDVYHGALIF
jgi:hypothetical protein